MHITNSISTENLIKYFYNSGFKLTFNCIVGDMGSLTEHFVSTRASITPIAGADVKAEFPIAILDGLRSTCEGISVVMMYSLAQQEVDLSTGEALVLPELIQHLFNVLDVSSFGLVRAERIEGALEHFAEEFASTKKCLERPDIIENTKKCYDAINETLVGKVDLPELELERPLPSSKRTTNVDSAADNNVAQFRPRKELH